MHDGRARALLDPRRGRALPVPLGLPVAEDDPGLARVSRARRRRAARRSRTRTCRTRRSTRSSSSRCAITRSSSSRCRSGSASSRRRTSASGATEPPSDWILRGQLSHKSQQVFEALLSSYHGSYIEVLKHVQVERYFISRRYRVGAVTIGPQLSVDAMERQITMDRSLQSLPPSLQAVTLYEAKGELVDAAGGVLEFSDLLKRPLDAFKYLQLSIETGEVALAAQNVQLNCVMMGSANELHLDAFREHAEFASLPRAARARSRAVPQELRAGAAHLRHARDAAGAPARRSARDRDGGALRGLHADAQAQPGPLPEGDRRHRVDADRDREGRPLLAGSRAGAPRRREPEAPARGDQGHLGGERLVPDLRGARRREPARDARRAPRRRAVHRVQVPQPAGRARGDRRALPAKERVRVAPAGRDRRRLSRREDVPRDARRRACSRPRSTSSTSRAASSRSSSTSSSSIGTCST